MCLASRVLPPLCSGPGATGRDERWDLGVPNGGGSVTDPVMRAWVVPGRSGAPGRLVNTERAVPACAPDEVLVEVEVCGICRTDLHLAEGDLAAKAPERVPGHEVVGTVVDRGAAAARFGIGDRVGIAWLRRTCGRCRACRSGRENLCRSSEYTGWDADGGFAEYATVPEGFA